MEREPGVTALPKNLQFRVGLLLGLTLMVAIGFVVYVLYARGVFEARQRLTLVADNAEGVSIGMDLTFSGFPIGRVNRMALGEDGRARIDIDVPRKDARWLRTSSVFTIERGVVGSARIRAYTGNLQDPPLADGALGKTDQRVFGEGGVMDSAQRALAQANGILGDLRETLKKADQVLADAQQVGANAKAATADLATLRAEVDASLRKVSGLIDEINRRWPFERSTEIRLP